MPVFDPDLSWAGPRHGNPAPQVHTKQKEDDCHQPVAIGTKVPEHPTGQSRGNPDQSNRDQNANRKQVGDQKRPAGAHLTLSLDKPDDQWDTG